MKKIVFALTSVFLIFFKLYSQTNFDLRSQYPSTTSSSYITNLASLTKYEEETILAAFDTIINSHIQFDYPQGGCQNRAHAMSLILSNKLKISHSKIWLFSPSNLNQTDQRKLEIDDKNYLAPNDVIKWNYHVAPCVLVSKGNKTDTLIIDPSLNKTKPLRISEWFAAMRNTKDSKYTFLNPDWYFFLTDNFGKVITGEFYKFAIDNRWCADNYRNLTLEKGLAINDLAIYIINKYLNTLRNSNVQADKDKFISLRKAFGNVDVLTEFFGKLNSYCGATVADNLSLKQYWQDHQALMSDAMAYYLSRLNHWTMKVQELEN
jgi:hypothetical protein